MKKLILALLLTVLSTKAVVFSTNNLAAGNHFLISGANVLQSLVLSTTNDTPTQVLVYDGAITNITAAWTNWTSYTTNVVYSYLTSTGTTNTVTNTVVFPVINPHAAATNNTVPIIAGVVTKQTPFVLTPPGGTIFTSRVTLSNNAAGVNAIVLYRNP
jgi:hypothetical protein